MIPFFTQSYFLSIYTYIYCYRLIISVFVKATDFLSFYLVEVNKKTEKWSLSCKSGSTEKNKDLQTFPCWKIITALPLTPLETPSKRAAKISPYRKLHHTVSVLTQHIALAY